ncbi:MAG: AraC family transcriptional regulator [Candidatus Binatia bacterium]
MKARASVSGVEILDLLEALRRLGAEPRALCRAVRVDPAALRAPEARVPVEVMTGLFAEAERRTRDWFVGLHAGELAAPTSPVPYLLLSSGRLEEGIRHAERLSHVIMDTLRIRLETDEETASVVFEPGNPTFVASRNAMDYLLMASVQALRRAVGVALRLHEVSFRHAGADGGAPEHARAFGCPVRFSADDDRLVFPRAALGAVSAFANPLIAAQIEKFVAAIAPQPGPRTTIRHEIAHATRALLSAGQRADRATVARQLGMSDRTLQRRLGAERFKDVRDEVVWEAVEALLSNPALKIEAIALSVGFADVAAFSKACKRRTKRTPTEIRERLLAPRKRRGRG